MEKAFLHGFMLALGLILPLGVQNLFILQQGMLQPDFWRTLPAIITAAACDTVLINAAVSGVSLLFIARPEARVTLLVAGGIFLLYMGWKNWRSPVAAAKDSPAALLTPRQQIVFAMSVSILNPYAFLDTFGVIGASSLQYTGMEKTAFTAAAVLVSWFWFTGLSLAGQVLGRLPDVMRNPLYINRFSAVFIWGSAFYLLLQGMQSF
jgi:L-lysine exporter family protein LysE/ArgO